MSAGNKAFSGGVRRIGLDGYCRILAYLAAAPRSMRDVSQHMALYPATTQHLLRWMLRLGLVHRASWFRPRPHSYMVPMWAFGGQGDVPRPDRAEIPPRAPLPSALVLLSTAAQIMAKPATQQQLQDELGMSEEPPRRVLHMLRKHGLVHVAEWIKPPIGTSIAKHRFGPGKDAPRPPRVPQTKRRRSYLARKRARLEADALRSQDPWLVMQKQLACAARGNADQGRPSQERRGTTQSKSSPA